jgi:hypothetical protein
MRLINEDEIDPHATRDCLDRANLDRLTVISALVDTLHNPNAVNALASNALTVWSIRLSAGTVKATRFPLSRARWMTWAALRVLPKPVGAWSIRRPCATSVNSNRPG